MCKHCQRRLCSECAALLGDVLACRDRHEQQVADLARMIETDAVQSGRVRSGYVRNGIFYGLVGVIFAVLGWNQLRFLGRRPCSSSCWASSCCTPPRPTCSRPADSAESCNFDCRAA